MNNQLADLPLRSAVRLALPARRYLLAEAARLSLAASPKVTILGQAKPDRTGKRQSRSAHQKVKSCRVLTPRCAQNINLLCQQ